MNKKIQIEQAKQWCRNNLIAVWGLMRLELMEEYAPAELNSLLENGTLETELEETDEEMRTEAEAMRKQGDMNLSEINETLRNKLLEKYAYQTEQQFNMEELIDKVMNNQTLTEDEREYLKENLPPSLAAEL